MTEEGIKLVIKNDDFSVNGVSVELLNNIKKVKKQIAENLIIEGHGGYFSNGKTYYDAMFMMTKEECQNVIDFLVQLKKYLPTMEEIIY